MPDSLSEFKFHEAGIFAGQTGVIDPGNHVIRGVSVITGGIEAEGHDLLVDDTTIKQLQSCAKAKGKIPVCLDHGSGVKDINGYLTGFRMDGNKLRADWHLLASHDETDKMLERAEKMPECFGLSVAFKGPPKGVPVGGGKMAARCERLLSVDCVTRPAANTGLFSIPEVDSIENDMAKATQADPNVAATVASGEPTLAQVLEQLQSINSRLDQHEQFLAQNAPEPTLEDLYNMKDEELAQLGITRAEVEDAVQEAVAAMESEQAAEGEQANEGELVGATEGANGATAGAAGGADTSAPATFKAISDRIIRLEKKLAAKELAEKEATEAIEFKSISDKITTLETQRNEALTSLEVIKADNDALRVAVKTGTRPVKAGVDFGVRMFGANDEGELHGFQARVKELVATGKTEGEAVKLAVKENPGQHADYVRSLSRK
jgi:hypothetical protein